MSETVKRYMATCDCMNEADWGDYVRHEDYARQEQECERLRGLLMEAKAALDPFDDKLLEARIDAGLSPKP